MLCVFLIIRKYQAIGGIDAFKDQRVLNVKSFDFPLPVGQLFPSIANLGGAGPAMIELAHGDGAISAILRRNPKMMTASIENHIFSLGWRAELDPRVVLILEWQ